MKTNLSTYWKANKAAIKRNWKKELIRAKYGFSILAYIQFHMDRMTEGRNIDINPAIIEKELYTTL